MWRDLSRVVSNHYVEKWRRITTNANEDFTISAAHLGNA